MKAMRFMQLNRLRAIFSVIAALIVVMALAAACGDDSDSDVEGDPDIRGTITDVSSGSGEILGSARIEGTIEPDTSYDAAVVRIDSDTEIFRTVGGELTEASFSDLSVGQQVEAWFTGAVADSYPVQAKAARIVILEDAPAAT